MFRVRILALLSLVFAALPVANAQGDCASLTGVTRAVQSVRDVQSQAHGQGGHADLSALSAALSDVPPAAALTAGIAAPERIDTETFDRYFRDLRVAVSSQPDASAIDPGSILMQPPPNAVGAALFELQRQIGCTASGAVVRAGPAGAGAYPVDADTGASSGDNSASGNQQAGSRPAAQPEEGSPANDGKVSGLILPIALIACIFSFGALWYRPWARQQSYRTTPRQRCDKTIPARVGKTEADVLVVDFNRHGMRMQHHGLIRRRCAIQFQIDGPWLKGKVMWTNDRFAGILFDKPLTDEQLKILSGSSQDERDAPMPQVRPEGPQAAVGPQAAPAPDGPVALPHKPDGVNIKA